MKEIDEQIKKLIDIAIDEDIGKGDLTTRACIPNTVVATGKLILKQAGVIAGLPFFKDLFLKIDPTIEVSFFVQEGSYHKSGTELAHVKGPVASLLTGERIALNLIQHASGIATITSAFVKKISGLDCSILDTRKTLPGLRALEKYAVRVGGGSNYRYGLDDRCLIKLNHLAYFHSTTCDPIFEAVKQVETHNPTLPIEIEIDDFEHLKKALKTNISAVILRRMTPDKTKKCVELIHRAGKKAYIESSGTITLNTVRIYAETGIDGILIGDITHSVQSLNMKFKLSPLQVNC